jgi:hypothetical protein
MVKHKSVFHKGNFNEGFNEIEIVAVDFFGVIMMDIDIFRKGIEDDEIINIQQNFPNFNIENKQEVIKHAKIAVNNFVEKMFECVEKES